MPPLGGKPRGGAAWKGGRVFGRAKRARHERQRGLYLSKRASIATGAHSAGVRLYRWPAGVRPGRIIGDRFDYAARTTSGQFAQVQRRGAAVLRDVSGQLAEV